MNERLDRLGRRFARLATRAAVAQPALWRLFRGPLRKNFEWLAPVWDERRSPSALAPLAAALEHVEPPRTALDLGTGTGKGARLLAERFPDAQVLGVDFAPAMIAEAERLLLESLSGRVRFQVADGAKLPLADGAFDLVVLLNMIPFFDELARVTAPGGTVVVVHSLGPETPIYTPAQTLREKLGPLGFEQLEELAAGEGTAFLARRRKPG